MVAVTSISEMAFLPAELLYYLQGDVTPVGINSTTQVARLCHVYWHHYTYDLICSRIDVTHSWTFFPHINRLWLNECHWLNADLDSNSVVHPMWCYTPFLVQSRVISTGERYVYSRTN